MKVQKYITTKQISELKLRRNSVKTPVFTAAVDTCRSLDN